MRTINFANIHNDFIVALNTCGAEGAAMVAAEKAEAAAKERLNKKRLTEDEEAAYEAAVERVMRTEAAATMDAAELKKATDREFLKPWREATKAATRRTEAISFTTISHFQSIVSPIMYGDFSKIDIEYLLMACGALSGSDGDGDELTTKARKKMDKFVNRVVNRSYYHRAKCENEITEKVIKNTWYEIILGISEGLVESGAVIIKDGMLELRTF